MAVKFGTKDWFGGFYDSALVAYYQGVVLVNSAGVEYSAASPLPVALQASPVSAAFSPTGVVALAVNTTTARVALTSAGPTALIVNTGSNVAYVNFGGSSVVATTSSYPVPAGWGVAFDIGTATYVAAITASSTTNLTITTGTGVPALVGGTATTGGGNAVTIADGADVTLGTIGDAAAAAGGTGTVSAKLREISTQLGGVPAALGITTRAASQPVVIADINSGEYETVAASQTAQVLGATGGTGDYLSGLLVIPATTSPGNVLLLDNATSITVFTGGATSVSNLVPFFIAFGMYSVSGAWKVTTGANVSVIGIGNFT